MALNELQQTRIIYLISGYIQGNLTSKEQEELHTWKATSPSRGQLFAELTDPAYRKAEIAGWKSQDTEISLEHIKARRSAVARTRQLWWPYAAAMSLFLVMGIYYYFQSRTTISDGRALAVHDIDPGSNKAILTLADGSTVLLDDSGEGTIAQQSGTTILKSGDGSIIYREGGNLDTKEEVYNTIETPIGGQYQVRLPDGSVVWLNAASTLKYPVSFKQGERRVELSGEAYFEVAKNKEMPFLVSSPKQIIQVLGTHFNVSAYPEEAAAQTTLLEGSVLVQSKTLPNAKVVRLEPGQQAVLKAGKLTKKTVDTSGAIAWKMGYLQFNGEELGSVLRRIARWYNVEIQYRDERLKHILISGSASRYEQASTVLKALEMTGAVRFTIEKQKIYVEKGD